MARDLELNVKSKTEGAGLATARAEVDRLARAADNAADQFRQASRDAAQLDRKLLETKAAAALLAREFNKTGDPAIKKQLDLQRSAANDLKRLRADIVGDTEKDAKRTATAFKAATADFQKAAGLAGTEAESAFADGFSGLLKNPTIIGIGAALGALLAI